jgi:folylpolyglutamate synthase/dihydropteroate synthase
MSEAVLEVSSTQYDFLNAKFLEAMNDIGRYGNEKYGKDSFNQRAKAGDRSRGTLARTNPEVIINHAHNHGAEYLSGVLHDHFHTRKHQLAAMAFNAMMEFYFAGLEDEAE